MRARLNMIWRLAICVLLTPAALQAHGGLKKSMPASGAVLTVVPREIRLEFSERAELTFTRIEISGPAGMVELGRLSLASDNSRAVTAAFKGQMVAGAYTVTWQMAGADGHPTRGKYAFSIAPAATGLAAVAPAPLSPASSADTSHLHPPGIAPVHHDPESFPDAGGFNSASPAYVAIRWLQFIAMFVLIGAVAFHNFVLRSVRRSQRTGSLALTASRGAARVGLYAALLLGLVAILRLLAQSYAMHSPGSGFAPAEMWSMIGLTTWGWGWLLQAVAAIGAITGFAAVRKTPAAGWAVATMSAVAGAFSPAFSGHAASAPTLRPLAVIADGLHVMGAAGWLGSLFILLVVGIPAAMKLEGDDRGTGVAHLVNAFSPTALAFAGLTLSAGVFAAWIHVGTIPGLWQTQYGKTLLLKIGVLGIVTATGAYNFLYAKPRLGKFEAARHIKRSATVEVAVALVVLLVTAVLVATPTAMDMKAMAPGPAETR